MHTIVGKTVANVTERNMAGRDMFKDTITWTETVIHWTDGTATAFSSTDAEVFDPFEWTEWDDENGEPVNPNDPEALLWAATEADTDDDAEALLLAASEADEPRAR